MALSFLFDPNKQFQSTGGVNEVGGFLRVFFNGTDDRATTYRNFDGGMNEPDIVLDTYGRAVVIVDDTKTYRLEVYNRLGGLMWTVSNYKARGGSGGGGENIAVQGTTDEIDVEETTEGGIKKFIISISQAVKNLIAGKQDALTFDNVPTEDSVNPVKSGGIYNAIEYVKSLIPEEGSSINILELADDWTDISTDFTLINGATIYDLYAQKTVADLKILLSRKLSLIYFSEDYMGLIGSSSIGKYWVTLLRYDGNDFYTAANGGAAGDNPKLFDFTNVTGVRHADPLFNMRTSGSWSTLDLCNIGYAGSIANDSGFAARRIINNSDSSTGFTVGHLCFSVKLKP